VSAREALGLLDQMQSPSERIGTQLLLAEILTGAGRVEEARSVAEQALAASEAIEHRVYAERARDLLGAPARV
jgi:hypothetical protein